jgi:hypothetical protein
MLVDDGGRREKLARRQWLFRLATCYLLRDREAGGSDLLLWSDSPRGFVARPIGLADAADIVGRLFDVTHTANQTPVSYGRLSPKSAWKDMIHLSLARLENGRAGFAFAGGAGDDRRLGLS